MPDRIGFLSEYEFEYLRLYKLYMDDGLTDRQLLELSEIARLLYPPISDRLGYGNDSAMIKAAYNIAMTGGKKAGYFVYTMGGYDVEYMRHDAVRYLEGTPRHHRDVRYREFEVVSLDGALSKGYEYNHGLKTRRLGNDKYKYEVNG